MLPQLPTQFILNHYVTNWNTSEEFWHIYLKIISTIHQREPVAVQAECQVARPDWALPMAADETLDAVVHTHLVEE
jgi:hypothetical protein